MEYALIAAVGVGVAVAAAGYAAYQASQARVWVVRVRGGVPQLVKGKVSQTVVAELAEVLQRHGVRGGAIYGLRRRGTVTLGFSRAIPANCRQALRNVWSMHAR
ncbi:MAG: DUF3634 family protein [Zavarzinella sp.]|nr:DUF3634 family protein [Zavarzinella sp.]